MIAVAWRLIRLGERGEVIAATAWGNWVDTIDQLIVALLDGETNIRFQSSREGMMQVERQEWWLDCANIAALYRWMIDNGYLDGSDTTDVHYYIQKPWKWDLEWQLMTTGRASSELAVAEPEADPFPSDEAR